jgi:hypothetical protein
VIFVPWLAARRAWGALASTAGGICLALVLPVVAYGVAGTIALHRDWWTTVTASTAPNLLNADNVSVAAMDAKWIGPGPLAAGLAAATGVALLAAAGLMFARRRGVARPESLEAALLLMLMPLLSPQGWDYVLLVSTPAVMHLVNPEAELPTWLRAATICALLVIALSLYDVMGRRADGAFMALSVITVCYLVLTGSLVALRLRRAA